MRRWNSTKVLIGRLIVVFGAVLGSLAGPRAAHAGDKMRVCVLEVEGTHNRNMHDDLVRLISQPYQILRDSTFYKAAKRLRIGKSVSPPQLRRLGRFLKLGAVIDGTLVASRGRYNLVLKVRDAKTGAVTERIRHTLRKAELSERDKQRVRRDMINALERIRLGRGASSGPGPAADADDDDDQAGGDVEDDVEDLEEDVEKPEKAEPKKKTRAELRAERRRKAQERREARRKALAEKRRKAREERLARKKALAEKRRKAREERERKRRAAAERRKNKNANSDEEDLDDEESVDDLEGDEEDLEGDRGKASSDDEEDLDDLEGDEEDLEGSDAKSGDEEGDKVAAADEGDDDDDDDAVGGGGEVSASAETKGAMGPAGFVAVAGLGAFSRSLSFDASSATNAPIDYSSSFVPAVAVGLELYPLGLGGGGGFLSHIGIDAAFEQALSLTSTVDPDGTGANNFEVATSFRRFGVGLRYRLAVGPAQLALRAGYGKSSFELDKPDGMMVDIPNTSYSYLDPGLDLVYPFGKLSLDLAARGLVIMNTGEIQQLDQYGRAKVLGFDFTGGLTYALGKTFGVRVGAALTQLSFTFEGNGTQSDRDGDGTQDVAGATDKYLAASLMLSYRH